MSSLLDRFLCLMELVERYPLADVHSLPRLLSHHRPIIWATIEGQQQPTYFKVDRSWLREAGFKEEVERMWITDDSYGLKTKRLAVKIDGLRRRLMVRNRLETTVKATLATRRGR